VSRRRSRGGTSVSLFPFLSILACVIGTLTLLIAGIAMGELLDPGAVYVKLPARLPEDERERTALHDLVTQANALEAMLAEAFETLKTLDTKRQDEPAEGAEGEKLKRLLSIRELKSRVEILREEREKLKRVLSIRELRSRVEILRETLTRLRARVRGAKAKEREEREKLERYKGSIQLRGSGVGLKPAFVECAATGLVLEPDAPVNKRATIRTKEIAKSKVYGGFLRRISVRKGWSVIFLIRPGGVDTFDRALTVALKQKVKHGYLPVPAGLRIDYSLFKSMR